MEWTTQEIFCEGANMNAETEDRVEPYGAEVGRRVCDDLLDLQHDYDEWAKRLEPGSAMQKHMTRCLAALEKLHGETASLFAETYGHLDPIAESEDADDDELSPEEADLVVKALSTIDHNQGRLMESLAAAGVL